ncbi:MAG: DNA mismatch repair protein MutS [Sphingomonas sp.]|nr:MAG: DNA mismatch repair protein MutS [Sphingomonas sp.]
MRAHLLHPDRGFDAAANDPIPFERDLELPVLLDAAAGGDKYLRGVMTAAFARVWRNDAATVRHRQGVLEDVLADPVGLRALYAIACEPFGRDHYWEYSLYGTEPSAKVSSAVRTLRSCLAVLRRLRDRCATLASGFRSAGLRGFHETLQRDLSDAYLVEAEADLQTLMFRRGVLLSAEVGGGGTPTGIVLRKPQKRDLSWFHSLLDPGGPSETIQLAPRDDAGGRTFAELQNAGLALISDALFDAAKHVLGFITATRAELAFYVGALNLHDRLTAIGESVCLPKIADGMCCRELRDPSLALTLGHRPIGNDVDACGRPLIVITGANRGGKSTFLRSFGLAQAMLQAGLFVTADAFAAPLRTGLFTHHRREEDRTMQSGKFDEELVRMDAIAAAVEPGGLVLFNESFAATNEREGAEVARQIVAALLESDVSIVFVTHMFELARAFLDDDRACFLRAERGEGGLRSFKLLPAKPLAESFGRDLYDRIFA